MRSEIKGLKNKKGSWDITVKVDDYLDVISFFTIGFSKFIESLEDEKAKMVFVNVMKGFCEDLCGAEKEKTMNNG